MDIEKYQAVIEGVLRKLKVPNNQKQDMMQECYLVLLEKQELIEGAHTSKLAAAEAACRNHIIDLWRTQGTKIPVESLDDPRVFHKAVKLSAEAIPDVSDEMMQEAMKTLPPDELEVITKLYTEGYSRMETAVVLGVHTNTVDRRAKLGIDKLKQYFGEV